MIKIVSKCIRWEWFPTHLVVLVVFIHSSIAFVFCDNFSSIFDDDLVGFKATVASNAVTTIRSLDNLYADSILSTTLATFL